jgi:hypothetical protein
MNFSRDAINKIIVIVLAGAVLFWLVNSYNAQKLKVGTKEAFEANSELLAGSTPDIGASEENKNETYKPVDYSTQQYPNDCFPKDKLTAEDLLPKDAANSTWAAVNASGQGDVKDQNFLNAGYHTGIDTVGSSLRNANLSIRSEPLNPQNEVSPWLQSTITGDLSRRPMEIGSDVC